MLKIDIDRVLAPERVFLRVSTLTKGSQAISFSVFSLGRPSSSFSIEKGDKSEKKNHMLSATSHIELEFLTKFLNKSKFQNWLILMYQRVPLHTISFYLHHSTHSNSFQTNFNFPEFRVRTFRKITSVAARENEPNENA